MKYCFPVSRLMVDSLAELFEKVTLSEVPGIRAVFRWSWCGAPQGVSLWEVRRAKRGGGTTRRGTG